MADRDFRDRDSGVITLAVTGLPVADHPSRVRQVANMREPYCDQDPRSFKCPVCSAGTGDPCRD